MYAQQHGTTIAAPKRLSYDLAALLPFWRHVPVAGVTRASSRRYVRHRLGEILDRRARHAEAVRQRKKTPRPPKPPSQATPARELATLNAAIKWCTDDGMLLYGRRAELPGRSRSRERWLTRQEAAMAMREARRSSQGRHLADWMRLAARTGQRKGAILALRWTQNTAGGWIDLERGIIDFNAVGRVQTNKRRPIIKIPRGLLCWLRAKRRNSLSDHVIERRIKRRGADGKLVPAGEPLADVRQGVERVCERAGLGHVTPHVWRHTSCTWHMHDGVPVEIAAGYVGMSAATFRAVYGHHHPDYQKAAVEAMS